jgi:hypothetical protein
MEGQTHGQVILNSEEGLLLFHVQFLSISAYARCAKKASVVTTFWSSGESWVKVKARSPYLSDAMPNLSLLARNEIGIGTEFRIRLSQCILKRLCLSEIFGWLN